ncbi:hypothetical protein [Kitasatospora purpeofusca]|uniref:hypothetical protein n=1 Tax=Kitasatospora purpeofusca TaxID=67352 RepID=UPI00386A8F5B|nr:hypothetical protein OIP63_09070 [Kitasatospora purpeofusca]
MEFTPHRIQSRLDALDGVHTQLQAQRGLGGLGDIDDGLDDITGSPGRRSSKWASPSRTADASRAVATTLFPRSSASRVNSA